MTCRDQCFVSRVETGRAVAESGQESRPKSRSTWDPPQPLSRPATADANDIGTESLSSARENRPLSSARGDRLLSSARGDRPLSSAREDRPLSSARGDRPLSSTRGDRPLSSARGDRPLSSARMTRPISARESSRISMLVIMLVLLCW